MMASIPGYNKGASDVAPSPISDEEFKQLKQTVLLTDEDERFLQMAGEVLDDQIEHVLDVWYNFVASHPHLVHYFSGADGQPNADYLARVRARFGQWIRDTCSARYDREWLNYQQEIALRHTPVKKNRTDRVSSVAKHVPLRYIVAFVVPITVTIRPFLAKKGHSSQDVEGMYNAWFKSVTLQVSLWSEPFTKVGLF
jgi:hypothetical protein